MKKYTLPKPFFFSLLLLMSLIRPGIMVGQEEKSTEQDTSVVIPEEPLTYKNKDWNEFDFGFTTFRIGGGFIMDYVAHSQDEDGETQSELAKIVLEDQFKTRDFRVILGGKFNTKLPLAWKTAIMWDGDNEEWLVRETGLVIGLPKLNSQVFIGRTKEGFSMPKIMNGHSPWGIERQPAVDLIPIMADGIRWYVYLPKSRVFGTVAAFNDVLSHEQKFSTFSEQYLLRLGWLPFYNKEEKKLLHIAGYARYGKPENGKFKVRSRPESNASPYFIDSGEFASDKTYSYGGEIYYTSGRWMLGTEGYTHNFKSDSSEEHTFAGADFVISYFLTGESRPYNTTGNIYQFVPVNKPLGQGGWGAWEAVFRISNFNLNEESGSIQGGNMTRITPMINWYVTRAVRIEFVYGYTILERFGLTGHTHLFQGRFQYTLF